MKRNKGITLIALVITIIVLLILAGVAISMLSGENGILRKAAEAKTKTDEKSLEERIKIAAMGALDDKTLTINKEKLKEELEISDDDDISEVSDGIVVKLDGKNIYINNKGTETEEIEEIDMILDSYFKDKKYKCRYGYITGLTVGEKVESLQAALPNNYYVKAKDGTDNFTVTDDNTTTGNPIVTTGLQIVNGEGIEVARTVLFGDVICTGKISTADGGQINLFLKKTTTSSLSNYQIVAMDVNHDGIINAVPKNINTEIDEINNKIDETEDAEEEKKLNDRLEELEKSTEEYDSGLINRVASQKSSKNIDQNAYAINILKYITK